MARAPDWHHAPMAKGDPAPRWPLTWPRPEIRDLVLRRRPPLRLHRRHLRALARGDRPHQDPRTAPSSSPPRTPPSSPSIGAGAPAPRPNSLKPPAASSSCSAASTPEHITSLASPSAKRFKKGHKLGRVLGSYGMIHLETYGDKDRKANAVWRVGNPIPRGLHQPHKIRREHGRRRPPAVDDAPSKPLRARRAAPPRGPLDELRRRPLGSSAGSPSPAPPSRSPTPYTPGGPHEPRPHRPRRRLFGADRPQPRSTRRPPAPSAPPPGIGCTP
jgi:hypothetical protein